MIRINLLPASERVTRARLLEVRLSQATLVAVLLTALVSWAGLEAATGRVEAELQTSQDAFADLQSTLQAATQAEALLAQRRAQVMAIDALRHRRAAPARLLARVTAAVPADAWLLEVRFATDERRRTVTIDGRALSFEAVGTFTSALRAGDADLQVDVVQAAAETMGETSVVRFLLRISAGEVVS